MEVIERRECAIEHFEAVLDEASAPRDVRTDAIMRLLSLYEDVADEEATRRTLRQFWGHGRPTSLRHVPYSARYFSAELDVFFVVDIERVHQAPIWKSFDFDVPMFLFTCDDAARDDMVAQHRVRRAERRAAEQGRTTAEVLADMDAKAAQWKEARSSTNPGPGGGFTTPPTFDLKEPIFAATVCRIAQAFGDPDLRAWKRVAGAMSHQNMERSMGVAEIPNLESKLVAAVANGALQALGPHRWSLSGVEYAGQPVHLVQLDTEELTIGRADMIDPVLEARSRRRKQWHSDIERLGVGIPQDVGFFVVLTAAAATGMGPSNVRPSTRQLMQALLPTPKGVQLAGVIGDRVGVFSRLHTDDPGKARMLVTMARWVIAQQSGNDPRVDRWLRYLDVAEAEDRQALLGSYVLPREQLRILLDE